MQHREVRFKKVPRKGFFPKKIDNRQNCFAMRRMTMNVGAFESPDLGGPSRYPEHVSLTSRKFFKDV